MEVSERRLSEFGCLTLENGALVTPLILVGVTRLKEWYLRVLNPVEVERGHHEQRSTIIQDTRIHFKAQRPLLPKRKLLHSSSHWSSSFIAFAYPSLAHPFLVLLP